ncbi:MAG TPA: 2-oxo acid dehydrogenase subunit E2 [Gammaproteobacteria bacterium]|nr:2-oxo acid dehydrogenase subunit E2 [Gammaproteobacteria bacterium]
MSEPVAVRVPQMNPNDEHAIVVRWHVAKGGRVRAGQTLATLETTKTTFDVDSPSDGYAFFEHEPNAELAVGAPLAWIADNDAPPRIAAPAAAVDSKPASAPAERFTRKARKLMKELGLGEADFAGVEKVDAEAVERAAAARAPKTPERVPPGAVPLELAPAKIAEIQVLKRVHEQVVPSTVTVALEAERVEARLRREAAEHGPVSALELALYETARLLPEWPELNGFYADGRAWSHATVAIGFAVNLGRSLRVPVVKNAGGASLRDVARAVRDLTLRYMRDELAIEDVTGGTFTITDLSGEGVVNFVPVLNERQSAILGLCAARGDGSRDLVLTFDHRLTDGMRAARFLATLRSRLEETPR